MTNSPVSSKTLGRVRFTVGLDDLKALFQPTRFCDSTKISTQRVSKAKDRQHKPQPWPQN